MKTRIKKVTYEDGNSKFYPQYRFLFVWWNFSDTDGWSSWIVSFLNESFAKEFIDKLIKDKKSETPSEVSYIKYP